MTVSFLDKLYSNAAGVIAAWAQHAPHAEIWIGETAAAWHSGRENVTDAFVSSFWYADAFGTLTVYNHTGFCRQCLLGGAYSLLDRTTRHPNPDFYTGLLWHTLMGPESFKVNVSAQGSSSQGTDTLRGYAHCADGALGGGVVLLLINIDAKVSFAVTLQGIDVTQSRNE